MMNNTNFTGNVTIKRCNIPNHHTFFQRTDHKKYYSNLKRLFVPNVEWG